MHTGLLSVAYPGFQRGGCLRSGPIRKVGGGGGGGGAVHFRSDIRKSGGGGGGGQSTSGPIYEKVGGGGGAVHFRSDTKSGGGGRYLCLAQRKYFINGYNVDQGGGGCSSTSHASANELNCRF